MVFLLLERNFYEVFFINFMGIFVLVKMDCFFVFEFYRVL